MTATVRVLGPVTDSLVAALAAAGLIPVTSTETFTTWVRPDPHPEEDQS